MADLFAALISAAFGASHGGGFGATFFPDGLSADMPGFAADTPAEAARKADTLKALHKKIEQARHQAFVLL